MRWLLGVLLLAALAAAPAAGAATIGEFQIEPGAPAGTHVPRYIQPGPDGTIWYADGGTSPGIGRIGTNGQRLAPIADPRRPVDLAVGPDGAVYWTSDNGVTRRGPDGVLISRELGPTYGIGFHTDGQLRFGRSVQGAAIVCPATTTPAFVATLETCETPLVRPGRITDLTVGPEGRLWGAWYEANQIRRLGVAGLGSELPFDLPAGSGPARMALGPDKNLWVTMFDAGAVDRVTEAAERTRFALPAGSGPNDIAVGPDGALWITDFKRGRILRMQTNGAVTDDLPIPTANSQPIGITAGPDGAVWFTESATGRIGRVALTRAGGNPAGAGTGTGAVDRAAPSFLRGVSFNPSRFRARRGSDIRFALSESGQVSITVERSASGRRAGRRCVAPTRRNRSRSRCTRYVIVGGLRRDGRQGENEIAFNGRVNGRTLSARRYRVTVTVTDAAGNVSQPSRAFFTIVRR